MSFTWFWLPENLWSSYFLVTLSIKNGGYAFLIRLDLMFSMSLWKEFQLLQILDDLSVKHLIKLILYENDVKLLKFKKYRSIYDIFEVLDFDYWYLKWIHEGKRWNVQLVLIL